MANQDYIISEVQFFKDKDDQKTLDFVDGTGINLDSVCNSKMPTIFEIKNASTEFGLEVTEISNEDNRIKILIKKDLNTKVWMIFTDIENNELEVNMFQIGRGSDLNLTIDFIKYLGKTHGNFLFYNDSASMSLITPEKEREIVIKEMNE